MNNYNTYEEQSGIEKYNGTFDQDSLGVTLIPTESIQILSSFGFNLLALFTFLSSCPANWKLNVKHLCKIFNCNKEKMYKTIDGLIEQGFLTRTIIRDQGRFACYHYRLHLRQIVKSSPYPEKPDLEKPDTVNPDTYKTKNLQNKEVKKDIYKNTREELSSPTSKIDPQPKTETANWPASTEHEYKEVLFTDEPLELSQQTSLSTRQQEIMFGASHQDILVFEALWALYPVKHGKERARTAWFTQGCHKMGEEIHLKLMEQLKNDARYQDEKYLPSLSKYILNKRYEDEVFKPKKKSFYNYKDTSWASSEFDDIFDKLD